MGAASTAPVPGLTQGPSPEGPQAHGAPSRGGSLLWPRLGPAGQPRHSSQSHRHTLQDFETNDELKCKVIGFLEEVMHDPELLTQERKAAANIIR